MNRKDFEAVTLALVLMCTILLVISIFQGLKIFELQERMTNAELNEEWVWAEFEVADQRTDRVLSNFPPMDHRVMVLELEVWGHGQADFQVPSALDTLRVRVDDLENDLKIIGLSMNPYRMNLELFLREFCHQAMMAGEYDQWEVCEYLPQ